MANPFSGLINSQLKSIFSNVMNAFLAEDGATVPCRLIYPETKLVICPNCEINPVTGKSSGVYKTGGPKPFTKGPCPVCQGLGKKAEEVDETVYLCVIWDYKKWLPMPFPIHTPEGYVQTLSNLTLLPKIKRAKEIVLNSNIEEYVVHRFTRDGEPNPCGCCVGDETFIVTMWKRVG
jgi:hypothetical protein